MVSTNKQKIFEELLKKKGILGPKGQVQQAGPQLKRRENPGPFPLSFAQHRIWFLQQFSPSSGAYNDPTALRINGPLNIGILEKTLDEIIRRHEVFRLCFPSREGKPVQQFRQDPDAGNPVSIPVSTLQTQTGENIDPLIAEWINRFAKEPFDLSKDRLIRPALLKIAQEDFVFVVNIHHIIMDGWSKGLMLKELMEIYHAFIEGKTSPLQPLSVSYTDYVQWQQEWMTGRVLDDCLSYWKKQLTAAPPMLELPTDYARPAVPSGGGAVHHFQLTPSLFQELRELAKKEDVTFFMLLLSAYNVLLYRYSDCEDILVGSPIAGRNRLELENIIGLFVNTLVLRTSLSRDPSFRELLQRVKTTALEAYSHQEMPFEKLVEELNPQRNLSINPVFQVMLQLQNAPMPPAHIAGTAITPIQIDTGFSQVDLSLTLWEEQGILKGSFEYNTDLFAPSTVQRFTTHFLTLLEGILEEVEKPIDSLPLMPEEELHRLLVEWNNTGCEYPEETSISQLFDQCTQEHPDEPAVFYASIGEDKEFSNQELSYRELHLESRKIAVSLVQTGVGPGALVAICMDNSLQLIAGIMAILKTGAAYIPMDPQYPPQRIKHMLDDAQPAALLVLQSDLPRFHYFKKPVLGIDFDLNKNKPLEEDQGRNTFTFPGKSGSLFKADGRDAACVIYTSGSTGVPKGIILEHRSIVNLIFSFLKSYKPGVGDSILPLTSIASASFVGEILPVLVSGARIVLAERAVLLDLKKLTALLEEQQVTILSTVPSMVARLNAQGWNPAKLRLLLSGGEALSPADVHHIPASIAVVNGYGLTETTVCSTYYILDRSLDLEKYPLIPAGKPVINTIIYILDKKMNPVPIGVPGEIYIGGHGLSRGYLNHPALTAERFVIKTKTLFEKRVLDSQKLLLTPLRGDLLWHQVPSGGFLNGQPLHEKELSIINYQLSIINENKKGDSQKNEEEKIQKGDSQELSINNYQLSVINENKKGDSQENEEEKIQKGDSQELSINNYQLSINNLKEEKGDTPLNKSFCGVQGRFLQKEPLGTLYRTGDLARWLEDGNIVFLGRIDKQVQVHGYRVELSEIETHLGLHPGIRDAAVIDREFGPGDRRLAAYYVVNQNEGHVSVSDLRDWLEKRIPVYMIPVFFEKVDSIPLNANGKVDVAALPVPSSERPELEVAYRAPQTEIEKGIVSIWQEFLKLEKIGVNDNFFDLGGHSLLLTQVHHKLSEQYKKDLTVVDLFRFPTVHSLAEFIAEEEKLKQQTSDRYSKIQERANKQRQVFSRQKTKL